MKEDGIELQNKRREIDHPRIHTKRHEENGAIRVVSCEFVDSFIYLL